MDFQKFEIFVLTSPEDSDAVRRGGDKKAPPAAHGRQAVPLHRSYFLHTQKAWGIFGMKSSFDLFGLHRNPLASCKMQAVSMQDGNASGLLYKAGGAE